MNHDLKIIFICDSWLKIFSCPPEQIFYLNVTREVKSWIKHDSWTILFCMMNFWLFYSLENVRIVFEGLWLGFDLTWTSYGLIGHN